MSCKYIAAAKDEENISSYKYNGFDSTKSSILKISKSDRKRIERGELTSETEMPRERNLSAYCFLDFVELLVTNTSFFP